MTSATTLVTDQPVLTAFPAGRAGPTTTSFQTSFRTRRTTMFQALHADLARAHRRRRHQSQLSRRELQRELDRRAQQELLLQMPRLLAR
ncbi:MAG TPA: hypothetical protein VH915_11255 [Pedococcus sp.]